MDGTAHYPSVPISYGVPVLCGIVHRAHPSKASLIEPLPNHALAQVSFYVFMTASSRFTWCVAAWGGSISPSCPSLDCSKQDDEHTETGQKEKIYKREAGSPEESDPRVKTFFTANPATVILIMIKWLFGYILNSNQMFEDPFRCDLDSRTVPSSVKNNDFACQTQSVRWHYFPLVCYRTMVAGPRQSRRISKVETSTALHRTLVVKYVYE